MGDAPPAPRPVVVLGEALVDVFEDSRRVAGGAPFNQARWLAALGVPTVFISRIGAGDAAGQALLDSAHAVGLHDAAIQRDVHHATGQVQVTLTPEPHYLIEADAAWDHIDTATAVAATEAADPAVLVFGTLAQRSEASRGAIRAAVARSAALKFVDLNLRDMPQQREVARHTLALADWLKLNEAELEQLLAWFVCDGLVPTAGAALAQARRELCRQFGLKRVVVTRGAAGWITLDADGAVDAQGSSPPVPQLVDTVGAGDAFSAVLVAGYAAQWPLARSLAAAAQLSSAVCGVRGALPSTTEQPGFIDHWARTLGFIAAPRPGLSA